MLQLDWAFASWLYNSFLTLVSSYHNLHATSSRFLCLYLDILCYLKVQACAKDNVAPDFELTLLHFIEQIGVAHDSSRVTYFATCLVQSRDGAYDRPFLNICQCRDLVECLCGTGTTGRWRAGKGRAEKEERE